jgi:hypothetical protein
MKKIVTFVLLGLLTFSSFAQKISVLTPITNLSGLEVFPVNQSGTTYTISAANILNYNKNNFNTYNQTTYSTAGGDAYTTTITGLPVTTDQVISVKFNAANTTTTPSIAIAGATITTAKTIQSQALPLTPGFIKSGATYLLKYDGTNWQLLGGGSGGTYNGSSPTTVTVGGLSSGSAISGNTYDAILQAILVPYINPVFNSFSNTQTQSVESGTTISGSKTFNWNITVNSGIVPTLTIYDATAAANLVTGVYNTGSVAQVITTKTLTNVGDTQSWYGIGNNTQNSTTFNSSTYTVTAYAYIWYDVVASAPTTGAGVRALTNSFFRTGGSSFILNTGTTQTKFFVALPPGSTISSVVDLDALGAVITSSYVAQTSINVLDNGGVGTSRAYNIYLMTIGTPYGTSHRHQVTFL